MTETLFHVKNIKFVKVQGSINSPVLSVIKSDHW